MLLLSHPVEWCVGVDYFSYNFPTLIELLYQSCMCVLVVLLVLQWLDSVTSFIDYLDRLVGCGAPHFCCAYGVRQLYLQARPSIMRSRSRRSSHLAVTTVNLYCTPALTFLLVWEWGFEQVGLWPGAASFRCMPSKFLCHESGNGDPFTHFRLK